MGRNVFKALLIESYVLSLPGSLLMILLRIVQRPELKPQKQADIAVRLDETKRHLQCTI